MTNKNNNKNNNKNVLEKRARVLALKEKIEEKRQCVEVVEFLLGGERYGFECIYVREVYPLKNLTLIPGTPGFVIGIISLRGEIISVVDLKKIFKMPSRGLTDLTRVIVLRDRQAKMEFGILAEEVVGTIPIAVRDLQPSLPTLTGIRAEYLKGVTKDRLIVLDAGKVLADKNMIVHQEMNG